MGLWNLVRNTVEGVTQTAVGTAKLAASPITGLVKEDAAEDALDNIDDGIRKVGCADDPEE